MAARLFRWWLRDYFASLINCNRTRLDAFTIQSGRQVMARVLVLYKTPVDGAAFDRYYFETHVPIAKKIPGLRRYEVSQGPVATPAGHSNVHLIATLHFDDLTAVQHAFASAEGRAAAKDVQKFATGGVEMLLFETREI
jgi:uncharacterized protein (TIGR02118 family)